MSTKRFAIKMAIKIIIYAVISTIALSLLVSPVISNTIALGQMQNDDTLYVLMETYNNVRPFVSIVYGFITALFAGTTIYDTYKFIQTKTKETVKEAAENGVDMIISHHPILFKGINKIDYE